MFICIILYYICLLVSLPNFAFIQLIFYSQMKEDAAQSLVTLLGSESVLGV